MTCRSSPPSSSPPRASGEAEPERAARHVGASEPHLRRRLWALLAALAGLLVSAAVWALSSHSGNYHHASMGRRGTLISALAAFLVGAAPAIIAFFEDLGRTVQ